MKIFIVKRSSKNRKIKKSVEVISDIKNYLKKNNDAKLILNNFNINIKGKSYYEIIDGIYILFDKDIDVAAKTIDGVMHLHKDLLDKSLETIIMRYVIHELVHICQHIKSENKEDLKSHNKNYLDNAEEIEAFRHQIKYDADNRGKNEANKYIDDLLEHHKYPKNKRKEKKQELKKYLEE